MAAVTLWLEGDSSDVPELEKKALDPTKTYAAGMEGLAALRGLAEARGLDAAAQALRNAEESLVEAHQQLATLVTARAIIYEKLAARRLCVELHDGEPVIKLDEPIKIHTALTTTNLSQAYLKRAPFFSWTSKMTALSWSIPAGTPGLGGTCPGATFGQSVIGAERLAELLARKTDTPLNVQEYADLVAAWQELYQGDERAVLTRWVAASVCQHCYATGGGYGYTSQVAAAALRMAWLQRALKTPAQSGGAETHFEEVMSFYLRAVPPWHDAYKQANQGVEPEAFRDWLYFRIHDSGDFFSVDYLKAWKRIAQQFERGERRILFWAPTRMWIFPRFVATLNAINDPPVNFIVRPSTYLTNTPAPKGPAENLGPGWANWTVVYHKDFLADAQAHGAFDVNCPAFDVSDEDGHTCRNGTRPEQAGGDGRVKGCRACWRLPALTINYKLH